MSDKTSRVAALSPEQLQRVFERLRAKAPTADTGIGRQTRDGDAIPLSFSQERLWFLDRLLPGTALYNLPSGVRLTGPLRPEILRRGLEEVVRRHEALRTTFAERDGQPFQVIAPEPDVRLPLVDLTGLPEERRAGEASRLLILEARRPFDLERGPLLRTLLVRTGPAEHAFGLTLHHIVSDGWSSGVLIREMAALYGAFAAGSASPLPVPLLQLADYAIWQRQRLQGPKLESLLAYWRGQLTGVPPLELPADRPRTERAVSAGRGGRLPLAIAPEPARRLQALAQAEGATFFMALLALFEALLARASGQEDFAVGSPIANRNRSELESVIGFFSNTVVLRADLRGAPGLRELLRRVREAAVGAYAHEEMPFEKLVEALQPERDLGRNPLFQVSFAFQNQPAAAVPMGEIRVSPLSASTAAAKFDLGMTWREQDGGLAGVIESDAELFDATTVARFARHFERLLGAALDEPDRPVASLPILEEAERHQLLREWSEPAARPAADATPVHRRIAAIAAARPEAPAIDGLTYGELARRARALAARLRQLGVGPEVRVPVIVGRTPELGIALLGVLEAGGAFVPLDPGYPEERLGLLLDTALEGQARPVVVASPAGFGAMPRRHARELDTVPVPDLPEGPEEEDAARVDAWSGTPDPLPDHPAYVIFTSGSTGTPKGVTLPHRGLAALVDWYGGAFGLKPEDRVSHLAGLGFDATVLEMWPALASGAALRMAPEAVRADPERLIGWLAAERVDVAFLPTPLAEAALGLDWPGGMALRAVSTGGDRLHQPPRPGLPFALVNLYGPTEGTVCATAFRMIPGGPGEPGEPPIGGPIGGMRVRVADPRGATVPIGVPGELWIGGAGLARGYLGLPGPTAAAFVPDPESGGEAPPGERLYRTGDRVRWRPDGRLEFLGRTDGQVKIRGVRIEPGEVESALLRHPAVRAAAVVAQSGPAGARLVAHVVLDEAGAAAGLAPFLRARLPEALVPGLFVERPDLPLTQNGKVDRAALAAESPDPEGAAYAPPETLTQELLAGIWEELLGREAVGIRDDFFALGGHSLLATRLLARVRAAFGVDLPVRSLFESPTVEALAAAIEAARETPGAGAGGESGKVGDGEAPASDLVPVPRAPGEMLPLSFSQERLWFLDRLDPGTPTFNIPMPVDLVADTEAGPDVPALAAALNEVVRRHESLRTTFHVVDGEPRQRVAAAMSLALPVVDLAGLPAPAAAREARRLAARQLLRRFDLERGPLLDALLLRLDGRRYRFLPVVHHIVADGWSVGVLVREVAALYEACAARRPSPLPPLAVQYPDFAVWQRRTLAARWDAELGYWLERLGGEIAPLDLPTDRPRPAVQTFSGLRCRKVLGAALAGRLRAFAQEEGATVFMVLLAAVDALFHRWTGQEDILVGAPVAGRQRVETEGLIGFFLNTLVLRADLSGDPSLRGLVARVREVTLGAFSHQEIPFEAILARLQGERDLSRTPLFQVMFNLLNFPAAEIRLPGVTLEAVTAPEVLSKFDMTFYVSEGTAGEGSIRLDVIYNADLFAAARIEDFLDQLEALLEGGLERPDEPLGRVALVTERARALLPDPAAPLDASWVGAVHELFAARARSAPDRPAIADRDGAWTYGELHEASERLAGWLAAHGVGRGDRVAVFAHRGAPVAAAVLGVLEAGAAFAMLDPAYPAGRLVDMLDLAAPRAWLHLEAAGPAPAEVVAWLDAASCPRFELPKGRGGAGDLLDRLAGFAGAAPGVEVGPDDIACVGFTSGSTGRPKAILGRHGPLSHFLPWQCERFGLSADDRFSLLSGLAHDPLQRDLFTPFFLGAAIAVPDPADLGIPGRLAAWMAREGVTVAHLTPAMGQVLTEPPASGERVKIPTLRRVLLVGDALTRLDVARIRRLAPEVTCVNLYGSTETQRAVGFHEADPEAEGNKQVLPLGRGMQDVQLLVLNRAGRLAGIGEVGEIAVRSPHLAQGYLGDEALTAERFRTNPFTGAPGDRLYRTGDLGRYLPDGEVAFAGRADLQVKIRGFRIEPAEIEACLGALPGVRESIVLPRGEGADRKLVAYVVPVHPETAGAADVAVLREGLRQRLPAYMVPAAFHLLERLPLTPNGKVDRKALAGIEPGEIGRGTAGGGTAAAPVPPGSDLERQIAAAWRDVLGVEHVGVHDNFFDLGGHSLMLVRLHGRLQEIAGRELPLIDLFAHPDVRSQAEMLGGAAGKVVEVAAPVRPAAPPVSGTGPTSNKIAIVGLAGRFPQAPDVETFWRNLRDGVDAVSSFSDEELLAAGTPPELLGDPRFLRARGVLQDEDLFDAAFFEYPPLQAELMDPQLRLFLECCWQALEDAGYDSSRFPGAIGVHAGVTLSTYFLHNLYTNPELIRAVGGYQAAIGTDRDYLTSQVSYKLGLTGPSVNVQTACSTSLVAVHLACQALLGGECDMALAGGVSIKVPQVTGYLYNEGGIDSATGRCRPFDAAADGTVWGSGLGVVVLKRLEDALAAGDAVRAVILGSAVNNDGSFKVGFTAPSVDAQARVIAAAQARAGVDPATVSYVEAHGTGTALGDPIEAMALRRAFRVSGGTADADGAACYLGSVKSNVGHLGAAAGVASLIKAVLALEHRQIPPSLHFERLNPAIDFAGTPFRIADRLIDWENGHGPRRAGVSSFGLGGTNAHVVLEEAPAVASEDAGPRPSRPWQTLLLSARGEPALAAAAANLAGWLERHPEADLADVAWTLETGRRAFPWRRAVVCRDLEQARRALAGADPEAVLDGWREDAGRPAAFLFPGQGAQYAGMARGLYEEEPVLRREIDACAAALVPHLGGLDLRELLFPPQDPEAIAAANRELTRTRFAQPALFAVEYALARLWMSWGVRPWALLGHSLGEYVAAALAGVFSLDDALALVAARGELMQALPEGAMASVELPEPAVLARLAEAHGDLSLAAVNAPSLCVVSGPEPAVAAFEARLAAQGVQTRRLHTSHAFHSAMVEPALAPFAERLARVELRPPSLPFVSNLTGDWITADQATDPAYWVRHLRAPVRFADGAARLLAGTGGEPPVLLEAGPGRALGSLVRQASEAGTAPPPTVASLRHPKDPDEDGAVLARARARLWLSGADLDWAAVHPGERRRRVPLPSYPFQRRRYWVEPKGTGLAPAGAAAESAGLSAEALEFQAAERERAATARPRHARPEDLRQAYVAPANELEARIAGLFEGLLGLSGVGGHDDFFELGGHSLLGTQLLSRLRDELRVELPLDALFAAPTPAGLAARIEAARQESAATAVAAAGPPLVPLPRTPQEPQPLSFGQERLWFLDRLQPGSTAYNIPAVLRLAGPLDPAVLERALGEVVRRHEVLRTTFPEAEGIPVQRIHPVDPAAPFTLAVQDVASEAEAYRLASEEASRPFDLAAGPVMRALLLRLGEADHLLAVTFHHIATDGWSLGVLVREMEALYHAFAAGDPSPLPELPLQYADFARWQREWLSGERLASEVGFWRERLSPEPPVLEMPVDHPRQAQETYRGGRLHVFFPAAVPEALAAAGHAGGATLFMALLAGFAAFLARYTGLDDVAVGSPIAGRTRAETEGLIGLFINTLVLRLGLADDPPFGAMLARAREAALAAYAHQEVPFEKLVEELQPERRLGSSPLFQVLLILQNTPSTVPARAGLELCPLDFHPGVSRFDLTLSLTETADGLGGYFEYKADLVEAATVRRWAGHLENLLLAAAADPDLRLSELPLLAAAERHQIVAGWNDTASAVPDATVHALFAAQARRAPEAVALVFEGEALAYRELDARSTLLARHLLERGLAPEGLVGIALGRSVELLVAVLGVLKAGGAYLPLDPSYPADRLAYMLADSGAGLLLAQGGLAARLPAFEGAAVLALEAGWGAGATPEPLPERAVDGASLAYVIYTSGSTGRPKGVQIPHRALTNFLLSMAREPGLTAADRLLAVTSLSFDIAALELYLPLLAGASLEMVSTAVAGDGPRLLERLGASGATVLQATPATWRMLLEAEWEAGSGPRPRLALAGGEAVAADLAASLAERAGAVWNVYGPTETTIWSSLWPAGGGAEGGATVPIGRPLANTGLYVLDPWGNPAPPGVPGELMIGGAGLARGYLGRPELTAERFVPDGLSGAPGARLYRTGDLVRRRAGDGALEFLGRLDQQVKVRGHRIELGEIEAALAGHPAVAQSAVVPVEGAGGAMLVAYVIPSDPSAADGAALRSHVAAALPAYMVPAAVVFLESFPLTPNRKVDRQALSRIKPRLEAGAVGAGAAAEYAAPRTPEEEVLAAVWADVLGRERVGIDDDFFALGGHSLLATRIASRVHRTLGVAPEVRWIFERPTVRGLAERIATAQGEARPAGLTSATVAAAPALVPAEPGRDRPLSFAQQRLWFLDRLEPGGHGYNLSTALRLEGDLDVAALGRALETIVRRHEALRTRFPEVEGQPVQAVEPEEEAGRIGALPVADLASLPPGARETELRRLATAAVTRPFDLQRGPVLRAALFRLGEREHALVAVVHHIAADAWSIGLFVRELTALYAGGRELPPLSVQYSDFAVWQRRWLAGATLDALVEAWREQLAGAPAGLDLPADRPYPPVQSYRGGSLPLRLDAEETAALRALCRGAGVTLFMALLAGFQALLHRYCGQDDVVVGSPIAGRTREEVEPLIGVFLNNLALRARFPAGISFGDLLAKVRETALGAYALQDLPFEKLVEELHPARDLARPPVFQVLLVLQNAPSAPLDLPGVAVSPLKVESGTAKYELAFWLAEDGGGVGGSFEYNSDLFDRETAARMLGHFRRLLGAATADPRAAVAGLPLLGEDERRLLVSGWNATAVEHAGPPVFAELFEAQAARLPDEVAVVAGSESLTYGELDRRANRLARHLRRLGVGPEGAPGVTSPVAGIALERSAELPVALLAVMKAGGAYLPLDPAYPEERLAFMLADSGAAVVITQEALRERLPLAAAWSVSLDADARAIGRESAAPPPPLAGGADGTGLAYVLYTSGSTGRPKGVEVPHAALANFLRSMRDRPGLGPRDVLVAVTSLSFDIAGLEIYLPLLAGARVVLASRDEAQDGSRLRALLQASGATVLQGTPATWRLLLAAGWPGDPGLKALVGGEALPADLAAELARRTAGLWNLYGPTETTIWSTVEEVHADAPVTIGRPIANTEVYVLDRLDPQGTPAPVGVAGELLIGGAGVARGYHGRPDLTAERFVPDPFGVTAERRGGRLYRTGDLARFRADGALEYLGRLDHQVKVHGFRIEPGEIEAALARHPAVAEAAVVASAVPGGARLAAFYVARQDIDREAGESELRAFLAASLPSYMVPASFTPLAALPLTPNGKVDRKALLADGPALAAAAPEKPAYAAPRGPVEEALAAIWGDVLGVERVGVHDDFFALGGHSILATRLMFQVRDRLGVDLPLRTLFEAPTVAALAAALGDGRQRHGDEADPAAELPRVQPDPAGRDLPFPLTDVQEAYWIGRSGAMELGSVSTHTYFEVDATGMDLDRLERALRRLIDRHGMLRAVVLPDGTQRILPEVPPYRIAVTDLCGLDPAAEAAGLQALRGRMSHQVLPADRWPLFEVAASRHGDDRLRIHVSFDLLIGDAWSFRIVGRDLFRFYEDPEADLPALELTFRDYVLAERSLRDGAAYRRALEYWRGRLADLPPAPALPLAKDPSQLAAPRFARRRGRLEPAVWSRLKERAARASLTPSGVLLAAYAEALGAWSASPRFTINLTLFNRLPLHPEVDDVVGDFTSLTLLAVEQRPGESFAERARRLQARLWEDLDHRLVSGVRVLRELREQARARGGEAPIMPVVFTSTLNQPGAEAPPEETPEAGKRDESYAITQTPQVWLDHQVFERGGALTWSWDAVEELFPAGLLDDLFAAYVGLVERLAHEDEVWTAPVRSLLPAAHRRLIAAANATAAPVPAGLLHEPFLEQAARRPEAVAVITPRREIPYGELDRASLALAHRLRELGVKPNQLVAVVMEKGWEQVVAVLAILRAGGAYMPVDARLPAERVRGLLEQGEARVALTQPAYAPHGTAFGIEGLTWIPIDETILASPAAAPLAPVQSPEDLAYVIFTSGSTGTPKGVMIDHRGALNTVVDCNRRFRVTPEDRVLALSSLSFDLSVWDIFGLLAAGGALVIPDAGAHRDPAHWSALGASAGVTLWNSVPALVEMMVEYAAGRPGVFPPAVRLVMMSGDWIPVRLPGRIRESLPRPVELISMGGATEASIWSILYPIGEVPAEWPSVPYGKAMVNQTFFALDDDLEPRPVGVPGALYIGGVGLAQGYWHDEEKTRGAFIVHPRSGERLYRTGDLGRLLPDGNLEFLGRNDTQVKVRGHRIELGEIETTLARHPAVTAAVVSAVGDGQARQLVGYVVLRQPENGTAAAAAPAPASAALISDPIERLRFKLRHPGLRRDDGRPAVDLPGGPPADGEVDALYLRRRSYRRYAPEPIPLADFAAWLACLRPVDVPGSPFPKYRYASAGNLYPVQLYLFVKAGRIENLAAGTYYYDPAHHRLVMLVEGDGINASLYDSVNHPVFEEAGFGLFLVARLAAIVPLYGERGRHFAALEAGLMTQLLETVAPDHHIGLSQIGGVRFEAVRGRLALEESHELVHTLLGGRLAPAQEGRAAFLAEAAEYHALVGLIGPVEEEPLAAVPVPTGRPAGDGEVFAELRELLRSRLPDYMVPAHFMRIEEVPLSSNGKVDRKALPVPEPLRAREPETGGSNGSNGAHGAGRPAAPPETELEKALAGIVGEVLGVPRVGRHDNFFDLGASSVHVVRVHNALRQTLGREVPMVEMFNHPSVALLARHLAGPAAGGETAALGAPETPGEPSAALEENRDRSERLKEGKDWRKQRLQKRQGRA